MKKKIVIGIVVVFISTIYLNGQSLSVDTAKLNSNYNELVNNPNTFERQKAFFEAFPSNWIEFIVTYNFLMPEQAENQIKAFGERVTLIPDSIYCEKLIEIAVGGIYKTDAANFFKSLLHRKMWSNTEGMLAIISTLRKGHQMQFWQYYWSNTVKSKRLETEYKYLLKLNFDTYQEEMKIMEIAFEFFYDGVNIDGGYLK